MTTPTVANEIFQVELEDADLTAAHAAYGTYTPLPIRHGTICDACWLRSRQVRGIGTFGCNHH